MAEESESENVGNDVGGMTAGQVSESYGNFGGSLAEALGAVSESLSSGTGGYDMSGYGGGGDAYENAMGPVEAGRFGIPGVEGTLAEAPGAFDVAGALSTPALGDINMNALEGGFNLSGIAGLGTEPDGVVGGGFGGDMVSGPAFSETLADVIGGNFPGGFNISGITSTPTTAAPFGGFEVGVMPGTQLGPSQQGQLGPGFGFTSPADVFVGAPYQGAEVNLLGASGIPGTRANALAEQQALMMEQVQQNPTYEISSAMPRQDVALSLRAGLLENLPEIPGVPNELRSSTLAAAAATPVTSFAQPVSTSFAPQTTPQATPSPAPQATPAPTQTSQAPVQSQQAPAPVSKDVSPGIVTPAVTNAPPGRPAAGPRSISGVERETFVDPLTRSPVTVATENGVQSITAGAAPRSGVAGLLDSPMFSTAVNTGLSLASPYLGLANLGLLATTGTSLYGQARSLATGQGFQTGGGLMGLVSQPGATQAAPTDIAYSGGESYYGAPTPPQMVAAVPPTEVINPQVVQRAPANPYGFNIADFVTTYDPRNYSDYLPAPSYRA